MESLTEQRYHSTGCCESTRGVDALMERYHTDREIVTGLLRNNPDELIRVIWTQSGPLAKDDECQCRMGAGTIRTSFACAQCTNMRRLIDFRMGGIDRAFQLECGEMAGASLVVSKVQTNYPNLKWDHVSAQMARNYLAQYSNLRSCGTPDISDMRCITGDSFTIRTLIQWMIQHHFEYNGLEHIPILYTAFICDGVGYSLSAAPSIGQMSQLHKLEQYHVSGGSPKSQQFGYAPLTTEVARTIVIQLLVILRELSEVQFSHGNPSIEALTFTDSPVSYKYEDVVVQGPITVQITDLWNSSATFENVHYYPKNLRTEMYLDKSMFAPEIVTRKVSMALCDKPEVVKRSSMCVPEDATLYRLSSSTVNIYTAMRQIGFPIFVGSFDFYCFMVSLMCDKSFYDAVIADHSLRSFWEMMWIPEDLGHVQKNIESQHNTDTVINPVHILRERWLRCDILNFIWDLLRSGL